MPLLHSMSFFLFAATYLGSTDLWYFLVYVYEWSKLVGHGWAQMRWGINYNSIDEWWCKRSLEAAVLAVFIPTCMCTTMLDVVGSCVNSSLCAWLNSIFGVVPYKNM